MFLQPDTNKRFGTQVEDACYVNRLYAMRVASGLCSLFEIDGAVEAVFAIVNKKLHECMLECI